MNTDKEVWRRIPRRIGLKSFYEVSNKGRIRSLGHVVLNGRYYPGHIHKISYSKRGYPRVRLHSANQNTSVAVDVHRLVAEVFLPNKHHYRYVIHRNNNLFDNSADNLKWSSHKSRHTNRTFVKNQRGTDKGPRPVYIDQLKKKFPSVMSAARALHKKDLKHSVREYYCGIEGICHGYVETLYKRYTGHFCKKG